MKSTSHSMGLFLQINYPWRGPATVIGITFQNLKVSLLTFFYISLLPGHWTLLTGRIFFWSISSTILHPTKKSLDKYGSSTGIMWEKCKFVLLRITSWSISFLFPQLGLHQMPTCRKILFLTLLLPSLTFRPLSLLSLLRSIAMRTPFCNPCSQSVSQSILVWSTPFHSLSREALDIIIIPRRRPILNCDISLLKQNWDKRLSSSGS